MLSFLSFMASSISARIASSGSSSEIDWGFADLGSARYPFKLYFWTLAGHRLTWGEAQGAMEAISDYMNEAKVWAVVDFMIYEGNERLGRGQIS